MKQALFSSAVKKKKIRGVLEGDVKSLLCKMKPTFGGVLFLYTLFRIFALLN